MRALASFAAASALALSGCVAGPAPEVATPTPVLPEAFVFSPDAQGLDLGALLPEGDPAYDTLAAQALAASPTLAESIARIEAARAGARRAGAELLPQVGADASVEFRRSNPAQFGGDLPAAIQFDTEQVAYAANLTARWDLDVFGRLKAQRRAARARVTEASWSAHAVRIALLSEIAASVIDWRTLSAREDALREDLASAEELARLAGVREEAGIAPGFDRVRAQSAANASRSRLAALASERARLVGRLVTLTGQGGATVVAALAQAESDLTLPEPPLTAPSTLLTNRPDVRAAMARLEAEDAELAAAARRRFPQLTLSGAIGLLAFGLDELFSEDSIVGAVAASVAAPLVDFGRIAAEIDGAAAEKKAAFEAYRGAVYSALGEAETAYGLVAAADAEAAAAAAEAESARRAASLAFTRNQAGLADFLTVLEARRSADASGERAAAAAGRARRARVLLWQALGGSPVATIPYEDVIQLGGR